MATLTWRGYATNIDGAGSDSTPTFSINIGSAASDRWVLLVIVGRENTYTAVTVNGVSLPNSRNHAEFQHAVTFWWGLVTTGSGTVTVACDTGGVGSASWAMSGCWTVTGGGSDTLTCRDSDGDYLNEIINTVGSFTLTTASGDWVFGGTNCLTAGSDGSVTWSQGTERADFAWGTQSFAVMDFVADGSSEVVQATHHDNITSPGATFAAFYLVSGNATLTTTTGNATAAGGTGEMTAVPPPLPVVDRAQFEVRTFASGAQDKVIPGAAIEFTDEFGTAGYVKVSLPALSLGATVVAKRQEVAVFKNGAELDNSRAILVEHTGNPGAADDAPGKSDVRVWGGKTMLGRLVKGIVYPENWPGVDPTYHGFDSGTTPGTIMKTLLNRAQTRGALSTITHSTWSGTLDSNGSAWAQTVGPIHYEAGVTLQAVLENLIRLGVVEARMVGRDLRLYNAETLGTDRTTGSNPLIVRRGRHLTDAPYSESTDDLQNALLVIGDEATIFERTDSASITEFGREEASLQQGGTKDTGTLTTLADASLGRYSDERGEYTAKFSSAAPEGAEPWADFFPGDWVYLDREGTNEKYRVRQLTLTTNGDQFDVTTTLNDKFSELDILMAKKVEGIIGGAGADTVQPAEPPPPEVPEDTTTPKAPTGIGASSDAYLDDQGNPQAAVTVSWTPPTENTDNTAIEDLAGHRVFMRDDSDAAAWMAIADVAADVTSTHYSPVQVGVYKRFTVEAYDATTHTSAKGTEARVLMDDDTTPPDAPSTPVLEDQLGTVVLKWDGKDAQGDAQPIDFAYLSVYRSQTSGFTPPGAGTLVGYMVGAGTFVPPEQAYGATWYYRLVSYDKSGNVSSPSTQASIAVAKVGTTDLVDQINTDIASGVEGYSIATGKNTNWYQSTAPTGTDHAVDDIWFDTDDGYKPYRWDGDSWEPVPWGSSALADGSVILGKLATGSVSTGALQAGAATMEKLAVGDLSNYVDINETYAPAVDAGTYVHQIETISSVRWSKRSVYTGTEFYFRNKKGPLPFVTGSRLRARVTAFSDSDTSAGLWLHTFLADGTYITSQQIGDSFTITTTAQEFLLEETVEAATMLNAAQYIIGLAGLTASRNVRVRNVRVWLMNAGELLVDGAVKANMVEALAIQTPHLAAGAVDATKLAALLILVGKIASAQTGRRWEADQYGIRLYETDGSMLINLPTDSLTPAVFKGDVVASSLTVVDRFLLRGLVNSIATNSILTLAAGTTAPGSPPQVVAGWDITAITPPFVPGSAYDPAMHGWVRDGSYYYTAQTGEDGSAYIFRYSATTLARDAGWSISLALWHPDGGVTVLGTDVYALGRNEHGTTWKVVRYTISTQAYVGQFDVTASLTDFQSGYWQALGNDGTNLMVAYRTTADGVKIRKFSTGGTPGTTILTDIDWSDHYYWHPTAVLYGNFDFGASRYVVAIENREDAVQDPMPYVLHDGGSGTWVNDTAEQWEVPGQTQGMCWDGTLSKFVRLDYSSAQVIKYTGITWSTESEVWWASTTWYDSNSTNGYHETDQGPRTQFTMKRRAKVTLASPPIPPRPSPTTDDDVMRPRFYLGRGATDPTRTGMWKQDEVADGVVVLSPSSPTFSGTNPPTTNGFLGSNPAKLQAADPGKFLVKGDGTGNWGSITVGATKTTIGTHVLRASALDTSSLTNDWQNLDWTGTTTVNEDTWTLSGDGYYWTCPLAGTYSVYVRLVHDACPGRIEMDVESTADGTVRVMASAALNSHDYTCASIPAVRMSVNDRILVKFDPGADSITIYDTGYLLVTRLG